jgi:hypothetical protein
VLVKELIEELQKCNPDEKVFIDVKTRDDNTVCCCIAYVDIEDGWPMIMTELCDVSTDYGENYN